MSTWNPQLWRVARRLAARYAAALGDRPRVYAPEDDWLELKERIRRLQTAEYHDWKKAAAQTRSGVLRDAERLVDRLRNLMATLRDDERRTVPSLPTIYEDLCGAQEEFGNVELAENLIAVTTEPIELKEIALGRFQIRLELDRITCDMPFTVVALEPNPAASSDATTHPHVNDERLCPGDGRKAIHAALAEGRLCDFFTVVDRILHTYARGAAYVELNRWCGIPCRDCDDTVGEDESYTCQRCNDVICDNCVVSCEACSDSLCSDCSERCQRCDARHCGGCLSPCIRCRRDVCSSCADEGVCETCLEELEEENDDEPATEEECAVAETTPSRDAPAEPAV
jgi:hypothetical protein